MGKKKSGKKKKKSAGKKTLAVIIAAVIVICAGICYAGSAVDKTSETAVLFNVSAGSGSSVIASGLKDRGLIRSASVFKLKAKISGHSEDFKAGTYAVKKSMSTGEIISLIASGKTAGKTFSIIEGEPVYKIADKLDSAGIVTKKDFYREIEKGQFDYAFMKYLPKGATRLEGFLYPDTYEVSLDATPHQVVDVMLKRFEDAADSGGYYKRAKKQGKTIFDIVTAASVIQKEAGGAEEMKKVSSVIENRIKQGMPLQMDSIISYIHKDDKIRATYSDIAVDSTYNPYKNKGLPPGPICSPGSDALEAALEPADTEYLYFVASPQMDGTNVFSKTYKEFLKNKKAFDKAYEKYVKEHPEEQ